MDRKATANETLRIMDQGWYEVEGRRIDIAGLQKESIAHSKLIFEARWPELEQSLPAPGAQKAVLRVANEASVKAVLDFCANKERVAVLNFASAKNPGGGFLNGAMAQEEALAASSGLYRTLTAHREYYDLNRAFGSMIYTDTAIYSPDVVFFRDDRFRLLEQPVTASVLTLPAVNFGQVLFKGEDPDTAKRAMRRRMKLALTAFAAMGDRNLVLGAYGCGVFRNDPKDVARWWKELLEEGFSSLFEQITFAVLDTSKNKSCISAFEEIFY